MEIYLIRHTSVDVPAGYAYGQTDVPLKPTFEEEAEEVKKGLSDHTFDKVWTSPLTRCVRLANYCGFPEAEREDRIKEVNFGEWEMKSWNELSSDPRSEAWFKDWVNNRLQTVNPYKINTTGLATSWMSFAKAGCKRYACSRMAGY